MTTTSLALPFESFAVNEWWPFVTGVTWQASLVALAAIAVARFGRRWPAPLRYAILVVALVKFALPPAIPVPTGIFTHVGPALVAESALLPESAPIETPAATPLPSAPAAMTPVAAEPRSAPPALAPPPPRAVDPRAILLALQALGTTAIVAFVVWRLAALRRLAARSRLVDSGPLHERFARLAAALGVRRVPALRVASESVAPMALGLLRPTVIVPEAALAAASAADADTILAHELAHHRRGDLAVNWLQIALSALFFWNPVLFFLNRSIRETREDACDDVLLARGIADGEAYCGVLVRAAAAVAGRPMFGAALGFADRLRHPLARRIARLMDRTIPRSARLSAAGLFATALLALAVWPGLRRAAATAGAEEPHVLEIRVVDASTGQPLADADIVVKRSGATWRHVDERRLATDASGLARVELPAARLPYLGIHAKRVGFVPKRAQWSSDGMLLDMPQEFTLALEPGTTIGGVVRDETGAPIANATVFLIVSEESGVRLSQQEGDVRVDLWDHPVTTDAEGRWRCEVVPARLDHIAIRLQHPDYVSDVTYGKSGAPGIGELRDLSAAMTMKKGLLLSGRVLDESGEPIAGARVLQGAERVGTRYPATTTDAEGEFSFAHTAPGPVVLTAIAAGHAPELESFDFDAATAPVEFRLGPGHSIRGRVVDAADRPLTDVLIAVDTWRTHRTLETLSVSTDSDGRFELRDAPVDALKVDVLKPGYRILRELTLSSGDASEIVVRLEAMRPGEVRGRVTSAADGDRIEEFEVRVGLVHPWGNGKPDFENAVRFSGNGGEFRVPIDDTTVGRAIEVSAPGYRPKKTPVLAAEDYGRVLELQLEEGSGPAGVVRLPNGAPLAGVEVHVASESMKIHVNGLDVRPSRKKLSARTDENGRFSFEPLEEGSVLVVVDARGFGTTPAGGKPAHDVVIEPWGRIEGVVAAAAKAGVPARVSARCGEERTSPNGLSHSREIVTTDTLGRFAIDRVASGEWVVAIATEPRPGTSRASHHTAVAVSAGKTAHVTIGGGGRPVVGRLVLPESVVGKAGPLSTLPLNVLPVAELESKRGFLKTIDADLRDDGRFRADDVPPGSYRMSYLLLPPARPGSPQRESLGQLRFSFELPPAPEGRPDEPFDLGDVPMTVYSNLAAGDVAPPIDAATLDGAPLRLADFRGRYVLLDFWATWCAPCVAEIPKLEDAWRRFGTHERFAMVSLSLDPKPEEPRRFVAERGLAWTQGFLGEWSKSDVPDAYGIRAIPAVFLVDPEGHVVARLRGEEIVPALERALGE